MKKIITLLTLLACYAIGISAANYPIQVKGITVTDDNKDDILGDGTMTYQSSNNMLILENCNVMTSSGNVITVSSEMTEHFYIYAIGDNRIVAENGHGIYYDGKKDMTIMSSATHQGTLSISAKSSAKMGIDINSEANIIIKEIKLDVTTDGIAIGTQANPTTQQLEITNCMLNLHGAISALKFTEIKLEKCQYAEGYAVNGFNSEYSATYDGTVMKDVKIEPISYNLTFYGEKVTSMNCNNILKSIYSDKNVVTYDPERKVLYLNNVDYTASSSNPIFYFQDDVTVLVKGKNTFNTWNYGFVHEGMLTLLGTTNDALLSITSQNGFVINSVDKQLMIQDLNFEAKSLKTAAINGYNNTETATFKNSKIKLQGIDNAAINYANINMIGNKYIVAYPYMAAYDTEQKKFLTKDKEPCSTIITGYNYNICVGNEHITDLNADNVTGPGITGKVWYDANINKLYIENANIVVTNTWDGARQTIGEGYGIYYGNTSGDFTISFKGTNTISTIDDAICLCSYNNNTLEADGDAKLTIKSKNDGVYSQGNLIYSGNLVTDIESNYRGIYIYNNNKVSFSFKGANNKLSVKGNQYAFRAKGDIDFNLENAYIENPQQAYYDTTNKYIANYYTKYYVTEMTICGGKAPFPILPDDATITVVSKTSNSIKIKWNPANDATTPQSDLKYYVNKDYKWVATTIGATEYEITGLTPSKEYLIGISADNGNNIITTYPDIKVITEAESTVTYDVKIGAVQVDENNAADVLGDGSVVYDHAAHTLTLNNANISANGNDAGIFIDEVGVHLVLNGNNTVTSQNHGLSVASAKFYIDSTTDGSLDITCGQEYNAINLSSLTAIEINDVNISMQGGENGISSSLSTASAKITNSNLTIKSAKRAAYNFHSLTLDNCYVAEPVNAKYMPFFKSFVDPDNTSTYYGNVTIKRGTSAIEGITTANADQPLYNLNGIKVNDTYKGIVIKGGKKVIMK